LIRDGNKTIDAWTKIISDVNNTEGIRWDIIFRIIEIILLKLFFKKSFKVFN
jgi:hypothetical protein